MSDQTCQHCAYFVDQPGLIEAEFPGLTVFGSAYSSARGHAGICERLDLFLDPMPGDQCPSFSVRAESSTRNEENGR